MSESTNITTMDPVVIQMKLKELELMKQKELDKKNKLHNYAEKRRVWTQLMISKAEKQGIVVTPEEVAKEIARLKKG